MAGKTTRSKASGGAKRPPALTAAEAVQGARNSLVVANASVESQVHVYEALGLAAEALKRDGGDSEQAALFQELRETRGKLLQQTADRTLQVAEQTFEHNGVKSSLAAALRAAIDVYSACDPKGKKLKELQDKARKLGAETRERKAQPARPFFARFLENQNRQRVSSLREKPDEVLVTRKAPSDHEDQGGDLGDGVTVTLKYPSDQEEGCPVTEKFPSDEEDAGCDGILVTLKAPSDHEDEGATWDDVVFVTLKYPSDHDEGTAPVETRKFPSDQEDIAIDTLAQTPVTMKAPSDHEDGGGGDLTVVTLKAPSDHEDQGEPPAGLQTRKFPSDAEDSGVGGEGPITLKFPSDEEDSGEARPGGTPGAVTLKFPSDADEGDYDDIDQPITLKYPSDKEDGGGDPGTVTTAKFPSDEEDHGAGLRHTLAVTMKFPSDNDEGDLWLDQGANVTTAKYPSDQDE